MLTVADNIDDIYLSLVHELLIAPKVDNTYELNNVRITLKNIDNNIVSVRNISPAYLFGELLWYFNADNSLKFISQFSSFWNHLSDDGETCNSAYGYLIWKKHDFNQVATVIDILRDDPNSRRAKININTPNKYVKTTKDEPCTMSLHFMIRDNRLNCTAVMRSNDIWFGFPYDVTFFTELQKYIASKLNVGYGEYTHFAVSLHAYEKDAEMLEKIEYKQSKKPINFNRPKFYDNIEYLFSVVKEYGKETLMETLETMNIYKEIKNED